MKYWMVIFLGLAMCGLLGAETQSAPAAVDTGAAQAAEPGSETPAPAEEAEEPAATVEDTAPAAEPIQETPVSTPVMAEEPSSEEFLASELGRVQTELAALRAQLETLQQTMDIYVGGVVNDLQTENNRLREEIRDLYSLRLEQAASSAEPPSYGAPAAEDVVDEGYSFPEPEAAPDAPGEDVETEEAAVPEGAPAYEVVSEWGRSPEEAAQLGNGAISLVGMICVVPIRLDRETLLDLGRELRKAFEGYDNINIEIFDNADAARNFVENNTDPEGHRVMSVSKHLRSGRDVIVLMEGDKATEVPWTGEPAPEPAEPTDQSSESGSSTQMSGSLR